MGQAFPGVRGTWPAAGPGKGDNLGLLGRCQNGTDGVRVTGVVPGLRRSCSCFPHPFPRKLLYLLASWQPSFPRQLWGTARGRITLRSWPRLPSATLVLLPEGHWGRAQGWTELCSFSACSRGGPNPRVSHSLTVGASPELSLGTAGRADPTGAGGLCPSAQLAKGGAPLPFSKGQGQASVPPPLPGHTDR